jgi:lipopolysaccharide transport system permease protein
MEVTYIKAHTGLQFPDLRELYQRRDLLVSFIWRQLKTEYAQSILGILWAIIQPLIQIVVFTVIFGKIAKITTGDIPYVLFASFGIIPWTYISSAMTGAVGSLLANKHILAKIYLPRLVYVLTPVVSRLFAFTVSIILLLIVAVYYRVMPTWRIILLPFFVVYMSMIALGPGLLLSTFSVRYRDVQHAMPFVIRMMMFAAPIVYPMTAIPEKYKMLYAMNPIVGAIDGFRACALGYNLDWTLIWPGMITALLLLVIGALYFKKMEQIFADVI